jgi:hypothetical protein
VIFCLTWGVMQPREPHLSIDYGIAWTQAVLVWPVRRVGDAIDGKTLRGSRTPDTAADHVMAGFSEGKAADSAGDQGCEVHSLPPRVRRRRSRGRGPLRGGQSGMTMPGV